MPDRITSVHNPRVRQAMKLRERDHRATQQRTLIDGTREIARALDAGIELIELFVCDESLREEAQRVVQIADERETQLFQVSQAVLSRLAFGERNEGLVATARPPIRTLSELQLSGEPMIAVLAGIEKPGNIGAVIRTADATGVAAVVVADGGTDLFNPNTIRASLGLIFSLPVVAASRNESLDWLRKHRYEVFATSAEGVKSYTDADLTGRVAFVLGNEAQGLDAGWTGPGVTSLSLPMCGVGDSLNVSVTAAVLFYESRRQRKTDRR